MKEIRDVLYDIFLRESRDQLISVYKSRVDMNGDCCEWGGCWAGFPRGISYSDVEKMVAR